jgi:hypothetical protein
MRTILEISTEMIEEEDLGCYFQQERWQRWIRWGLARKGWEVLAWAEEESMEAQKIWDLSNRWGRDEVLGKNNGL